MSTSAAARPPRKWITSLFGITKVLKTFEERGKRSALCAVAAKWKHASPLGTKMREQFGVTVWLSERNRISLGLCARQSVIGNRHCVMLSTFILLEQFYAYVGAMLFPSAYRRSNRANNGRHRVPRGESKTNSGERKAEA